VADHAPERAQVELGLVGEFLFFTRPARWHRQVAKLLRQKARVELAVEPIPPTDPEGITRPADGCRDKCGERRQQVEAAVRAMTVVGPRR